MRDMRRDRCRLNPACRPGGGLSAPYRLREPILCPRPWISAVTSGEDVALAGGRTRRGRRGPADGEGTRAAREAARELPRVAGELADYRALARSRRPSPWRWVASVGQHRRRSPNAWQREGQSFGNDWKMVSRLRVRRSRRSYLFATQLRLYRRAWPARAWAPIPQRSARWCSWRRRTTAGISLSGCWRRRSASAAGAKPVASNALQGCTPVLLITDAQ